MMYRIHYNYGSPVDITDLSTILIDTAHGGMRQLTQVDIETLHRLDSLRLCAWAILVIIR